uniref:CDK5RAP3-like protein n=1 Tax=Bursaphelenchus xylophilus TaxID=6326 RepID=A0A1I7RP62_BURXY
MDQLAIDIHSNKLLDWLISRRHCQNDWIKKSADIREKIKRAILDMPENERILELLRGGSINFFHCKEIVEILKETEKDSKNVFGFYSSQRMKDWQEIVDLYKKNNVFLAESAQILQRLVQFEIPALRRGNQRAENQIKEAQKREVDAVKQAEDARNSYQRELKRFGIKGEKIKKELLDLAKDLPTKFNELAKEASQFLPAAEFFENVQKYNEVGDIQKLELLKRLGEKGVDFTVYEWKNGKEPKEIKRIDFHEDEKEVQDDEIDFGDDIDFGDGAGIDFGDDINIEVVGDESGIQEGAAEVVDDGIARFENAFSIFEHQETFQTLQAEVEQLLVFLQFRIQDELASDPAQVYISSLMSKPKEIESVTLEQLQKWKKSLEEFQKKLTDPLTRHLAKIRSSPGYVEDLVNQLDQKKKHEGKYKQIERLSKEKQAELVEQISRDSETMESLCESARELQSQIEDAISELYKGREVNIVGEISAVLYD